MRVPLQATAANGGILTPADEIAEAAGLTEREIPYHFDKTVYENRLYFGFGKAQEEAPLKYGPNIADWPAMRRCRKTSCWKRPASYTIR